MSWIWNEKGLGHICQDGTVEYTVALSSTSDIGVLNVNTFFGYVNKSSAVRYVPFRIYANVKSSSTASKLRMYNNKFELCALKGSTLTISFKVTKTQSQYSQYAYAYTTTISNVSISSLLKLPAAVTLKVVVGSNTLTYTLPADTLSKSFSDTVSAYTVNAAYPTYTVTYSTGTYGSKSFSGTVVSSGSTAGSISKTYALLVS